MNQRTTNEPNQSIRIRSVPTVTDSLYFYCKGKSVVDSLKCLGVFRRYGMVLDKTEWMLSEVSDPGDVS